MSMPWNVIRVTLSSSSHYPSDAMSMQCPCHGMLSSWHYILAHITQAMQCPCNVHGMECCQGDITHGIQCPCYGMWSRWQHSRWHYPRDAMSFCRQMTPMEPSLELLFTLMTAQQPPLDQYNRSMCTLRVVKTITPRLLVKAIGKISRYHRYLYFGCSSMDDILKVKVYPFL